MVTSDVIRLFTVATVSSKGWWARHTPWLWSILTVLGFSLEDTASSHITISTPVTIVHLRWMLSSLRANVKPSLQPHGLAQWNIGTPTACNWGLDTMLPDQMPSLCALMGHLCTVVECSFSFQWGLFEHISQMMKSWYYILLPSYL